MAPSPRATFGRDIGLQVRMLLTMALLGLLYVVFVVVLLAAGVGTALMLVIVAGLALAQLSLSDGLALRAIGAREVSPREAPAPHAIIERLCVQADDAGRVSGRSRPEMGSGPHRPSCVRLRESTDGEHWSGGT
jgi:hypothetical protein